MTYDRLFVLVSTFDGSTDCEIYRTHGEAVTAARRIVDEFIEDEDDMTIPKWCESDDDVIQWYNETNIYGSVVDVYPTRVN